MANQARRVKTRRAREEAMRQVCDLLGPYGWARRGPNGRCEIGQHIDGHACVLGRGGSWHEAFAAARLRLDEASLEAAVHRSVAELEDEFQPPATPAPPQRCDAPHCDQWVPKEVAEWVALDPDRNRPAVCGPVCYENAMRAERRTQ